MVLDSLLLILRSGPTLLPFSKDKGTHYDWAEGLRCGALRRSSVLHRQAIVTRRTLPPSSELEPGIGEAAAPVKMLSSRRSFFVVCPSHHRDCAIYSDAISLGYQDVVVIGPIRGCLHELPFSHQFSVGFGNDKVVCQKQLQGRRIVVQLRLVPGVFERHELCLILFVRRTLAEYCPGPSSDLRGQQNAAQFDYRKSAVSSHERLPPHCPTNRLNARILKAGLPRHKVDS
jgi:hypothetical protein